MVAPRRQGSSDGGSESRLRDRSYLFALVVFAACGVAVLLRTFALAALTIGVGGGTTQPKRKEEPSRRFELCGGCPQAQAPCHAAGVRIRVASERRDWYGRGDGRGGGRGRG